MLILNLETEDFTVTAKEHNSNNISDVLSITVKQRKTKKEINYSVKKELYAKVIKIILEKLLNLWCAYENFKYRII